MKLERSAAAIAIASSVLLAGAVAVAGPASATQYNDCTHGQTLCFYYQAWAYRSTSAVAAFDNGNIPDMLGPVLYFGSSGQGSGQQVANNSHSVKNYYTDHTAYIYYSKNFGTPYDTYGPGSGGDLNASLVNNDRSFRTTE
jgi:hypothetical protein